MNTNIKLYMISKTISFLMLSAVIFYTITNKHFMSDAKVHMIIIYISITNHTK